MDYWYYEKNGQRVGEIAEAQMAELIERRVIDGATLVWSQGLAAWAPLATTDLARFLTSSSTPPPLPASSIPNGVVWVLAVAPLIGLFLECVVAGVMAGDAADVDRAIALAIASGTYWYISLGINVGLSLLDERRLRAAGVDTAGFGKVAFLVPVYLWKRAKALKQGAGYFWVWIGAFVFVLLSALGAEEAMRADRVERPDISVEQASPARVEVLPEAGGKMSPAVERCVDGKIKAFRDELGPEVPIRMDVLSEWEAECRKKYPT